MLRLQVLLYKIQYPKLAKHQRYFSLYVFFVKILELTSVIVNDYAFCKQELAYLDHQLIRKQKLPL